MSKDHGTEMQTGVLAKCQRTRAGMRRQGLGKPLLRQRQRRRESVWEGQTLPAVWEWVGARRGKGWLEGSVILFCNMLPSTALGRSKCSIFHSRCNFFFFLIKIIRIYTHIFASQRTEFLKCYHHLVLHLPTWQESLHLAFSKFT